VAAVGERAPTDVCVIIPTYNYGRFIGRAISSVLAQTHPAAEIVVVDDGSTDDTAEVLASFGSAITVIRQRNQGVSAARNAALAQSTAPLVALLDADDAWRPRKLEAQVARLAAEPGIGLVHCGIDEVDAEGRFVRRRVQGSEGWVAPDVLLLKPAILTAGCTALIPRHVFDAVGGFDERLSTSADFDLCLRIGVEFPIAFVPESLVFYTLHPGGMHRNVAVTEHDALLAYEKAVTAHPQVFASVRTEALANLYMMLGGAYFTAHDFRHAARYIAKSLRVRPGHVRYLLEYPKRRLRAPASVG